MKRRRLNQFIDLKGLWGFYYRESSVPTIQFISSFHVLSNTSEYAFIQWHSYRNKKWRKGRKELVTLKWLNEMNALFVDTAQECRKEVEEHYAYRAELLKKKGEVNG